MFKEMLKRQTTIAHTVEDCEKYSPFKMWFNENSQRYVVSRISADGTSSCVAAGLDKEEAEACIMVKANQHIIRNM